MRFGTGTACLSLVLLFWGCNPPDDTPEGSDNELVVTRGEGKDNWWDALPRPAWNVFTKVGESQG